tara:strand:+ start:137 stop:364 length:228 start_codon:yes stop_codon:yes gene_type:complete
MSESNKLGPYVQRLMTTILDKDQEEFVTNLALSELKRLNSDIASFVMKHEIPEQEKHKEKELLTEDKQEKKDGKK